MCYLTAHTHIDHSTHVENRSLCESVSPCIIYFHPERKAVLRFWQAIHPLIRTSQVSLSSNPDADFRYSTIYTTVGIYKGRVFAIKKVYKKSIDITREMKKELKMVRIELNRKNQIQYSIQNIRETWNSVFLK